MIGFIIAAGCAIALIFLGFSRHFRHGRRRHALYCLFRRLKTTPGQEQVIRTAFSRLRETGNNAMKDTQDARTELADMMRAESFDESGAKTWFAARQKAIEEFKPSFIESLREVHSVLDPEQRAMLGDALSTKWMLGPYRYGYRNER